ncbi:hypothetical protein ABT294_39660 [Nonomuraea sp. NPDC000554]|uniref:hypothetical protein n=1 Tax=Nonomuraea sp. NPDC000554 TaxID=3154259 RepID=UPI0033281F35
MTTFIRKSLAALTVAGAASAGLLATAPTQANADTQTIAHALGNAPSCVQVWETKGNVTKTGWARNNCGHALNLKIVWANGGDGSCRRVENGGSIGHTVARWPRRFDGAGLC